MAWKLWLMFWTAWACLALGAVASGLVCVHLARGLWREVSAWRASRRELYPVVALRRGAGAKSGKEF